MSTNKVQSFSRADTSSLGRWWWTVDRLVLLAVFALIFIGIVLSFAASPAIADRLKLDGFFFVKRHIFMVVPASILMIWLSLLTPRELRRVASLVFLAGLFFMCLTFFIGMEIKGARRWINLAGFSLQPSEFVKPAFAVLSAWMLSEGMKKSNFPGFLASFGLLALYGVLLLLQPDLGMTLVAVCTWIGQLFIAGVSLFWFALVAVFGMLGLIGAYFFFPHVTKRIDQFLDPTSGDPKH
ncbi:MAG TPA: FtsW/RodA/SpoVE family cell cycle protein, partial [Alphaproteobacteria bacterium]|nr:FtsW/RodA/SpoVE family cell cycle protein [Alphaproteobacteria bacterium]